MATSMTTCRNSCGEIGMKGPTSLDRVRSRLTLTTPKLLWKYVFHFISVGGDVLYYINLLFRVVNSEWESFNVRYNKALSSEQKEAERQI